jgi:hypothetical protein
VKGFAILSRAYEEDVKERYPFIGRLWGTNRLIMPYKNDEYEFDNILGGNISVPPGFENMKIKTAQKACARKYGHVVSRDFNIRYNPFFYHSGLIRALDFLTVSLGCDVRLNEVVIADAATYEGRNAFRLLLPIARRILLVTDRKKELIEEVDYAMMRYGTSVAVIEDPVKAAERADIVVIASDNQYHKYLTELNRPMLFFRYATPPITKWWFNDISISYKGEGDMDSLYAQGYIDVINREPLWNSAEKEGFSIKSIKKRNMKILER